MMQSGAVINDGSSIGLTPSRPSSAGVLLCVAVASVLLAAGRVNAQEAAAGAASGPRPAPQSAPTGGASAYDRIWRFAEWYDDDANRVVQRVQFSGRYQHDYARVDADQGEHDEWNVRRLRLGMRATLFRDFTLHGEAEFNPQERDPLYDRLTDFYLQWSPAPRLAVTVGKQGVPFTSEGATSSRELIAIDRSALANNIWFTEEYMPGISVSGRSSPWSYRAGVYSAGSANREFGEFDGGVFTLGVLGYDVGPALGLREALVTANYLYQPDDPRNTFTRPLRHIVSVHTRVEDGAWGVRTDVAAAAGSLGQSDLRGVMAMPFVNLTPRAQLVLRYTWVESDEPNGVRLAAYESRVVAGRGDRYREVYAGANYYLYGHKLKLQTGVQWGDMDDSANDGGAYSGVSWTSGVRVGW
jgi:phosphate-selective porin OprO and OprP